MFGQIVHFVSSLPKQKSRRVFKFQPHLIQLRVRAAYEMSRLLYVLEGEIEAGENFDYMLYYDNPFENQAILSDKVKFALTCGGRPAHNRLDSVTSYRRDMYNRYCDSIAELPLAVKNWESTQSAFWEGRVKYHTEIAEACIAVLNNSVDTLNELGIDKVFRIQISQRRENGSIICPFEEQTVIDDSVFKGLKIVQAAQNRELDKLEPLRVQLVKFYDSIVSNGVA